MTKYPRRCDATGRGIYQGYVVGNDELYFEEQSDLLIHLYQIDWVDADGKRSTDIDDDDELMEFFYKEEYYYYTEWTKFDIDDVYYDAEGNEYEC